MEDVRDVKIKRLEVELARKEIELEAVRSIYQACRDAERKHPEYRFNFDGKVEIEQ
jgi:hypothetical protein